MLIAHKAYTEAYANAVSSPPAPAIVPIPHLFPVLGGHPPAVGGMFPITPLIHPQPMAVAGSSNVPMLQNAKRVARSGADGPSAKRQKQ